MNKLIMLAAVLALAIVSVSIQNVNAQMNMTGLADKVKSLLPSGSLAKATQPGDIIFTLVCPGDFAGDVNKCQVFVGQPLPPQ